MRYKSLGDFCVLLNKEFKKDKENLRSSLSLELVILYIANTILYFTFFYIVAIVIDAFWDFIENQVLIATILTAFWEILVKFVKNIGFTVAQRFSFKELYNFELKPSYQIYGILFSLNIVLYLTIKAFPTFFIKQSKHG